MKDKPEFLDREKTVEITLADSDDGAGSAVVKMAPVETRDPYGDMLMSGAFDKQKGAVLPVLPGHQPDRPPLGKITYTGEKSGKFLGAMEFNETDGGAGVAEGRQDRRCPGVRPVPRVHEGRRAGRGEGPQHQEGRPPRTVPYRSRRDAGHRAIPRQSGRAGPARNRPGGTIHLGRLPRAI